MDVITRIKNSIRTVPNFPAEGIMFRDLTTLMKDSEAFSLSCDCLESAARDLLPFDKIAGIEARGFVFGSVLADRLGAGFVTVRKPGKLPAETVSVDYELEYGSDTVEVHRDAVVAGEKYLVVYDLLATGGTAEAVCRLIENNGGIMAGCLFLVELTELAGREKLEGRNVVSILGFEGK